MEGIFCFRQSLFFFYISSHSPFFRNAILLALSLLQLTRKEKKYKKIPHTCNRCAAMQCTEDQRFPPFVSPVSLCGLFFIFTPHFLQHPLQATQRRTDLPAQRTKYGGWGTGRVDSSWRLLVGAVQTPGVGKATRGSWVGLLLRSGGSRDRWARVAVEGDLGRMRVLLSGRRGGSRNLVLEFLGCAKKNNYKHGGGWTFWMGEIHGCKVLLIIREL